MITYYDSVEDRLVQIGSMSTPGFWEGHWRRRDIKKLLKTVKVKRSIVSVTKKYLKTGIVLEAGCGAGDKVCALDAAGYKVIGVDFAKQTVQGVKSLMPQLDVRVGDVQNLAFSDRYFDGYWSLGVIEHFYGGYMPVIREMHRVLKPGGYAFLTFPCI